MMGLPAKDITLIDNLAKVGTGLGVKVAGDHTDIKALMKNYPSYKKNFLRIQLISDKLNEFKGKSFDRIIIALEKKARLGNRRVREDALEEMKKLIWKLIDNEIFYREKASTLQTFLKTNYLLPSKNIQKQKQYHLWVALHVINIFAHN